MSDVYGFKTGKNKQPLDPLLDEKQDQHLTASVALLAANWSSYEQTVSVTGVTASNTVFVSPAPNSVKAFSEYGVVCTDQGNGTLTFECNVTPANNLLVNVVIFG